MSVSKILAILDINLRVTFLKYNNNENYRGADIEILKKQIHNWSFVNICKCVIKIIDLNVISYFLMELLFKERYHGCLYWSTENPNVLVNICNLSTQQIPTLWNFLLILYYLLLLIYYYCFDDNVASEK